MSGHIKSTDMLMVGKTGTGKSALGNAILQRRTFISKNSTESVTKVANYDFCEFDGRVLKVVDGPGLGDTELDPTDAVNLVIEAMSKAITLGHKGYHAILLVVRYGGRFTKEDSETVSTLKKIFGEKFITDHAILVLTCGDSFQNDTKESKQTFQAWCDEQGGVFGRLYTEVKKRAILFNNTTKEEDIIYDQRKRLLDIVDGLGGRYTSKMFEEAKRSRYRLSQGERCLMKESAIREAGVITQILSRVDYKNPAEGLRQLNDLENRIDRLLLDILKQDKGTKRLSVALKLVQNLKTNTAEQLKEMQRLEESKQSARSNPKILTQDECQNVVMQKAQQKNSHGRDEKQCVAGMARKKERMDRADKEQETERLAWENTRATEGLNMSISQLVVGKQQSLNEKVAKLEKDYQEVKEEHRSTVMTAAPSIFTKIRSAIGFGGRSRQK